MAGKSRLIPDYIFETSWEVCNKVGGIYTVLSTRAKTLQDAFKDKIIFIGPDLSDEGGNRDFIEVAGLFKAWKNYALESENLRVRVGRWDIPGKPIAILVDYQPYFSHKDQVYYRMWEEFGVDSMNAYGDYDESCIFAYAVGLVIESFYKYHQLDQLNVIAHFNEWMLGMGALYINDKLPAVATIFTTHATSIGRSIAGNNKPLYAYLEAYDGDQMAEELNMEAKHSLEKQAAHHVDCFTTVSDITACECGQLLEKLPHIVTPNGFEDNFVPKKQNYSKKRKDARNILLQVAGQLTGEKIDDNALMVAISGRYEYKNKGIDVFIEAMNRVRLSFAGNEHSRQVLAFILVPGWNKCPRADLQARLQHPEINTNPLPEPYITHELHDPGSDKVHGYLKYLHFVNRSADRVKLIFVPSYLVGNDGIFNLPYYDVLIGMDMTVFPSYYEPWGYTPLESIAFGIPTITTNLAGFGIWAMKEVSADNLSKGVEVLERTDDNYFDVAERIKRVILEYIDYPEKKIQETRLAASVLSEKASWKHFIEYYFDAYNIALKNKEKRQSKKFAIDKSVKY